MDSGYEFLLETPLGKRWEKIGVKRRAGIALPLFSIHSRKSAGIGEFPDIKPAVDWCKATGNSILQLLPLNDTGSLPSPFSAQTSIGLNPVHISLSSLIGIKDSDEEEKNIRDRFSIEMPVDHRIGVEKVKALRSIFAKGVEMPERFKKFTELNKDWLDDYALFRSLKRHHNERSWKDWDKGYRDRESVDLFIKDNESEILFWKWVQWQAFEQLSEVKEYAEKKGVLIKGDIPLFVSDDSVDCWSDRKYFKMDLLTGTPPDDFSKKGQIWGMPPYEWSAIMEDDLRPFQKRLSYAENFYHLFRIDHVIGLFRTWVMEVGAISATDGRFDPPEPDDQRMRGETILRSLTNRSEMLPCAEDLGTVPDFCRETIKELGIPGLDVGRWQKKYRSMAVATLSTHDMDLFPTWLEKKGLDRENIKTGFDEVLSSPSIFSIILAFDWLFLSGAIDPMEAPKYRINKPGTNSPENWSARIPFSMEELLVSPGNGTILSAVRDHLREV